jgi:hypothetical protein
MSVDIGNLNADEIDVEIGDISIPAITPIKGIDYWTPADKQEIINEAVRSVNEIILPQERTRQSNEVERINAENTRQSNENQRQSNETTRQNNEAIREANELGRKQNEFSRNQTFNFLFDQVQSAIDGIHTSQEEYDENATAKTTAFNNNATSKTTDFNNNATAKTTAYNENATAKIAEYDAHVTDFQAELDELDNTKLNVSKVKTTTSTTSGDVYDVTYINTMLGDIESILEALDVGGGVQ